MYEDIEKTISSTFSKSETEEIMNTIKLNLHYYEYEEGILTLEYRDGQVYQMHGDNPEAEDVYYILDDRRSQK